MNSNVQTMTLTDGRVLSYSEYGDSKGKPVFYFHGWPSSRLSAAIHDPDARKLGVRLIAVDRPGYGYSSYKPNRALLDWPDDVVALADHLKIQKFAVMGVSGGGPYAAVCAYKIPKRLTNVGIVVGLSPIYAKEALDGVFWLSRIGWMNFARFPALRVFSCTLQMLQSRYRFSQRLYRYVLGRADRAFSSDPKHALRMQNNVREGFRQGIRAAELDLRLYTTPWRFDIRKIRVPVYLWYGENDTNVSVNMGKYYEKQIANSTLTIYPGEGHFVAVSHAEEILKALT
jgi:pimeloyl-ACP methyl ester carboxylesterase